MKRKQISTLLGQTALFGVLSGDALNALAEEAIARRFVRGDYIFHQGDSGDCLYVIAEGHIRLFVASEDGTEMVLATLRPPDLFGELAVIDGGPRSASAKVIEPTTLLAFARPAFQGMLREHPLLAESLHRTLGSLLRHVLEQASDLIFLDLPGRVAKLLITLAEASGEQKEEGILLDLRLTQGTIASMVGGSRSTVNQILHTFEARGMVGFEGRRIIIKNEDALRRRAWRH